MIRLLFAAILIQGIIGAASPFFTNSQSFAAEDRKGFLPTEGPSIQVQGDRISLDVRDADISDVLREIANRATIDVTLGEGVTGKVSMKLTDVTIEEALKTLCRSSALVYEYLPDKKVYRIIHAVALTTGTNEKKGSEAETSGSNGPETKQALSAALSGKANPKAGSRVSQGDSGTDAGNRKRPSFKSGELMVRFKPGVTDQQIDDLHRSLGSTVLGTIKNLRLHRIKLREGLSEEAAMALYRAADIVEHVEKHALRYPTMTPNDPDISRQWGLAKMKAREAWDITRGRPEVIVAVIDTGVDYSHPDLQDNIWLNTAELTAELNGVKDKDEDGNGYIDDIRGWDFVGNDANIPKADNDPMDVYGHGTHVAGIIAATGNNGTGIAGINWQVKIMALKAADNGGTFLEFSIIEAIQYAIAKGAKIINCSFGGDSRSVEEENAFIALKNAGILAVCAAGNDGRNTNTNITPKYPSSYDLDNIISVTASDENDNLATFSNYGSTSVDLMAPGVNIYSTWPQGTNTDARIRISGTSPIEYTALGMAFAGTTDANGIIGTAYDCGKGYPWQFPAGVGDYIAVIERGNSPDLPSFTFAAKVSNAQTAGAKGVIIYNYDIGIFSGTLGSPGYPPWVPVVSVTKANGEALIALGNPVVTLINKLVTNPYHFNSGTSMAAPQVAGIAGLTLAQCPSLRYADIKSALLNTVDKFPEVVDKMVSGGRVNAFAALTSILVPGDLSGDCRIGLDDAILALQILSGLPPQLPYPCPSCGKDVSGDNKIGLQEAIFILQNVAGMR
jgi:subtilisin family serine protease